MKKILLKDTIDHAYKHRKLHQPRAAPVMDASDRAARGEP